jgi:hypothetical protein
MSIIGFDHLFESHLFLQCITTDRPLDAPFGGFGQSGHGRELGRGSSDSYVATKTVSTSFETVQGDANAVLLPIVMDSLVDFTCAYGYTLS